MPTQKTTAKSTKSNASKARVENGANSEFTDNISKQNEGARYIKSDGVEPMLKADPSQIITVRNGFRGRLVYISPRTKETFVWDNFGDEQEIELRELRNAKSAAKKFFSNNWFMFDDEFLWVIGYLGVSQYYKNSLQINDFDRLFDKSPEEIENIVSKLSQGQKRSVAYTAREKVANKEIDSIKTISVLEKALGISLTER